MSFLIHTNAAYKVFENLVKKGYNICSAHENLFESDFINPEKYWRARYLYIVLAFKTPKSGIDYTCIMYSAKSYDEAGNRIPLKNLEYVLLEMEYSLPKKKVITGGQDLYDDGIFCHDTDAPEKPF